MRSEYQFHESLGERDAHLAYCARAAATLARLNAKPSLLARVRRLLGIK